MRIPGSISAHNYRQACGERARKGKKEDKSEKKDEYDVFKTPQEGAIDVGQKS